MPSMGNGLRPGRGRGNACVPLCAMSVFSASRRAVTPAIAGPAPSGPAAEPATPCWCRPFRALDEAQKKNLPRSLKGNLCRCTGYRSITDAIHGITEVEEDVAGKACGASLRNPFGESIVTGRARYTMDIAMEGLLHLKVLRSPHAHAKILKIDRSKAM